jgi:hypothetical protein
MKPRLFTPALLFLSLLSCPARPTGDCGEIRDPVRREDCLLEGALEAWARGPEALEAHLAGNPSAQSRDLLRLRIAIQDPSRGTPLCERTETEAAREKCRQVLGRPHLRSQPKGPEAPSSEVGP